jgi:hypothetical protein
MSATAMRPVLPAALSLAIIFAAASARHVAAQAVPTRLADVDVAARVALDAASGLFTYDYRVANPRTNDTRVTAFHVEVTLGADAASLRVDGLVNGPRYTFHGSEAAAATVRMVPVGVVPPANWTAGLAYDDRVPPRGLAGWGAIYETSLIPPGQSLGDFRLTSYGLPAIRAARVLPFIDVDALPQEYVTSPEKAGVLRDTLTFWTSTVGPQAPPQTVVPLEFVNYLMTLVHDSERVGWIRESKDARDLLRRLVAAKRRLERNEPAKAARRVEQFMKEVEREACRDFTCRRKTRLTSEAYAVLFFNARFLLERLPPPFEGDDDD